MKILCDADFIVYKACAAAETEIDWGDDTILVTSNFSDAYSATKRELNKLENKFGSLSTLILFFSDSVNFRKKILPEYKGHRNRKKPCGYKRVINALKEEYKVIIKPTLEADDSMGIYATKHPGNIIASPDKDMRQIPGKLYNFDETFTITPEEGAKWHLIQGSSAIIAKRWMVLTHERLPEHTNQLAFVHDELQFETKEEQVEELKSLLELTAVEAGEYYKIRCPIAAEAKSGDTWADVH